MQVLFTDNAKEEYQFWQKTDLKMVTRIKKLIANIKEHPYQGLGKPEPLKHK